jgi:hypothetical protein
MFTIMQLCLRKRVYVNKCVAVNVRALFYQCERALVCCKHVYINGEYIITECKLGGAHYKRVYVNEEARWRALCYCKRGGALVTRAPELCASL